MRVVTFHNVVAGACDIFDRDLYRLPVMRFARTLDMMAKQFDVVPMEGALARLAEGREEARDLVVTFDDGFAGVAEYALPLMRERGMVGTVFVLTGVGGVIEPQALLHFERLEIAFRLTSKTSLDLGALGLGVVEMGTEAQRSAVMKKAKTSLKLLPQARWRELYQDVVGQLGVSAGEVDAYARGKEKFRKLSPEQIEEMRRLGWSFGGHTRSHPALSSLDAAGLEEEVSGNRRELVPVFGAGPLPFAFPYGSPALVGAQAVDAVREAGFGCAFTMTLGEIKPGDDLFQLKRYSDTALAAEMMLGDGFQQKFAGAR